MHRVLWGEGILAETERNLARLTSGERARQTVAFLREIFPEALVADDPSLVPATTVDEKDRHVLAAAIVAGAQVIVTFNLRHFPVGALEPYRVAAQGPDEFLLNLLDLDPERVIEIIEQQAAALQRPPLTASDVLDQLAIHAPTFANQARLLIRPRELPG